MMNLALFGYGKMGKAIEQIAINQGHNIVLKVTRDTNLDDIDLKNLILDAAIEFSTPESAFGNIEFCLQHNIPVVSGTTGWLDQLPEIKALTNETGGTFFYAANFSLGVNLFFKLNKQLAKLLAPYKYTSEIEETHHIHKKDAPSGTAITLAEDIIANTPTHWVERNEQSNSGLPILSIRQDEVPGTHKVTYQGSTDRIIIQHEAKNRIGFAIGAVAVAEWIRSKKGVLTMDDFFNSRVDF